MKQNKTACHPLLCLYYISHTGFPPEILQRPVVGLPGKPTDSPTCNNNDNKNNNVTVGVNVLSVMSFDLYLIYLK